ncbi:alpha/beta fold hydrolase [Litoribrevibacter euphylliae]|uniref:Alpha/beta fold hydrolase n=1 Tax=Litoribrevibacter euphylliae TaxID=1834034 RepID=A0ABV7HMC5_9GAMM
MATKATPKFSIYSTQDRTPMHFSGANGFPVGCYDALLNGLSQRFSITSVWHKALWPGIGDPNDALTWDDYADDLIQHLKTKHNRPVVGVGHSMGASITLIAAAKAPKLFSKLVLIEPVIISPLQSFLCQYSPQSWLSGIEPVKSTLKKPSQWKSKEQALAYFKQNTAYKRIPQEQLTTILNSMVEQEGQHTKLVYPLNWEIANYLAGRNILSDVKKLKVPTAFIRGKPSLFVHDKSWHRLMRAKPKLHYITERDYGHLMPFEAPQITRQLIMSTLKKMDED